MTTTEIEHEPPSQSPLDVVGLIQSLPGHTGSNVNTDRLLLVGDHVLLLEGLAKLLHDRTGADVNTSSNWQEISHTIQRLRPAIIIAETSNVPAVAEHLVRIERTGGQPPLLVIAPGDREQFLAALRAGARGFVGRDATAAQLLGCIAAVQRGEWGLPRVLVGDLAEAYRELFAAGVPPPLDLSAREQHILRLLARGMSAHGIGTQLYLSESTVRAEIRSLAQRLGVANRMQLVTEALRRGLVTPD